jgi:hypothetical protein
MPVRMMHTEAHPLHMIQHVIKRHRMHNIQSHKTTLLITPLNSKCNIRLCVVTATSFAYVLRIHHIKPHIPIKVMRFEDVASVVKFLKSNILVCTSDS